MKPREGIGASLLRVAWALHRALSFDLEPIFAGPLLAAHGRHDFGDFMGLTHNPLLVVQDAAAFVSATSESVPFAGGDDLIWFGEQENRTSVVVYEVDAMDIVKAKEWGITISPPSRKSGV